MIFLLTRRVSSVKNYFKVTYFKHSYHSKTGVYGFIPGLKAVQFEVPEEWKKNRISNPHLYQLISAFREHGHKVALLDPLSPVSEIQECTILNPATYGLNNFDETLHDLTGLLQANANQMRISDIENLLKQYYCGHIALEVQHLVEEEKEWIIQTFETLQNTSSLSNNDCLEIANILIKSQVFDRFLATKFSNVKRYGGEGAESMMPFFNTIIKESAVHGITNIAVGIPHRGRLNLLTGLLHFPPVAMFRKMKGLSEFPDSARVTGDVLSHLRISTDFPFEKGIVRVSMLPNPSHLEAISPVVVGKARGMMQSFEIGDYAKNQDLSSMSKILSIQVHGDASFTGQGVIMETLAMSQVPHFRVGGSLHLVVNNQIGFTTEQDRGRSSTYCSDIMKMIDAPVIHVNGNYPEEVVKAASLALAYRQKFQKDVLVDLLCFRRWGHNELDDPMFANPSMYRIIHSHKSVPDSYCESLIERGILSEKDSTDMTNSYSAFLNEELKNIDSYQPENVSFKGRWQYMKQADHEISQWDTGIPMDLLQYIGLKSATAPENLTVHSTLVKHFISDRLQKIKEGAAVDWATAEAMSIGSLLCQGSHVRISGQDVGRGTFSHRHFMLIDQKTDEMHVPLNHIYDDQKGLLEVANSILSEEAVLSFEYGFSLDNPKNLVIWEAQFGDFFNSAQVVFDTFISSTETKWLLQSGIVILLPHGYDGAGPEHSSCRMERFLQMCDSKENEIDGDDVNWSIVNPTTPSQYFHLLRRQIVPNYRRPLIIVAPKILLRHPEAVSKLSDMEPGKMFSPVLNDDHVKPSAVKTIIFCSGKHYYLLKKERELRNKMDTAIIRLEELCPFPASTISEIINNYKKVSDYVWSQEEPRNMGAWSFVNARFQNILHCKLRYAGRDCLATPAVGVGVRHHAEIKSVIEKTFQGK